VQLFGLERALELAEVSEWLDWMRRELPAAALDLPNEETSVLFAANAVRLVERIRPLCHHLPAELRARAVEAAILHQCWQRQRKLCERAKGMPRLRTRLALVELKRYLQCLDEPGRCLVEGNDGFSYITMCRPRTGHQTTLATHMIGVEVASLMGLPQSKSVALARGEKSSCSGVTAGQGSCPCRGPCQAEPGVGVRCREADSEPTTASAGLRDRARRVSGLDIGWLVFNILMLNNAPEMQHPHPAQGSSQQLAPDLSHCLADADWSKFLGSTCAEPAAPAWAAGRVRNVEQLSHWLHRLEQLDTSPLWELAFQLPPEWYGEDRPMLVRVLEKIEERLWNLRRTVDHLARIGYFPNLKKGCVSTAELVRATELNRKAVVQ